MSERCTQYWLKSMKLITIHASYRICYTSIVIYPTPHIRAFLDSAFHFPVNPSKMTFTPQAPGSGTFSFFNASLSTYALLPAFASNSLVFSVATMAACTAPSKSLPSCPKLSIKALRGSTSVREGLRARVYVYSFVRAKVSAWPQAAGVTVFRSDPGGKDD
jgi:hypothetical protein